jgi:hypothetical protein
MAGPETYRSRYGVAAPEAPESEPAIAEPAQQEQDFGYDEATPTTYQNPQADERGMGPAPRPLEMGAGYAWQPDFYPSAREPHVIGRTRGVGKYQGADVYNQTAGLYPVDVSASRLQYIQNERKELQKLAAKASNPLEGLEDLHRAEYRDIGHRWAFEQLNREQDSVIELYGGDTTKAMADLSNPATAVGRQHKERLDAINTVFRLANQNTKTAQQVITDMENGVKQWDQKLYDESQDVLHGISTGGDPQVLAKQNRNYATMVDLRSYIEKSGLQRMLGDAMVEIDTLGKVQNMGGKWFLPKDTTISTPEGLVDAVAKSLAPRYAMQLGQDEVRDIVSQYASSAKRLKDPLVQNFPKAAKAKEDKGDRDGWINGGWQQNGIRVDVQPLGKNSVRRTYGQDGRETTTAYDGYALKIRRDSDGEWKDIGPVQLRNSNGVNIYMQPEEIVRRNGKWFISGKQYAYGKQQAEKDPAASPLDALDKPASAGYPTQGFKELQHILVPFDKNNDWAKAYGINPDEIIGMYRGGQQAPASISPADFDAQWSKLPKGGTLVGPDGKTYRKN